MKEKKAKGLVVIALDEIACMTNVCTMVAMIDFCILFLLNEKSDKFSNVLQFRQ